MNCSSYPALHEPRSHPFRKKYSGGSHELVDLHGAPSYTRVLSPNSLVLNKQDKKV